MRKMKMDRGKLEKNRKGRELESDSNLLRPLY